ncbi:MAG: chemotaxis protein CheA [Clostridia bacterium]|jgi:two-component system chemotaxis sensor kinase CheA|nr:chemotaxis protein CheA [Clostridia bacterium]MDH7572606.1 chemotaxis protein CheA [Clostridia bacterium]
MGQYLSLFLEETEEQLQLMDQNLVLLEEHPEDLELLNRIFRAAHTIKGAAASMGFERLAGLTHAMEEVLDKLRQGRLAVTSRVVDVLLACLDVLRELKEEVSGGREQTVEVEDLVGRLRALTGGAGGDIRPVAKSAAGTRADLDLNDVERHLVEAAYLKGFRVWHLVVTLEEGCLMKAARAYIVYKNLEEIGEIIKTVPPAEDIEAERFDRTLSFVLVTREDADVAASVVKSTSEIASVAVEAVNLEAGEEKPAAVEAPTVAQASPSGKEELAARRAEDARSGQTVRVDVQRLDNLMNLVGELVIDRTRLAEVEASLQGRLGSSGLLETLEEISVHIGRITGELQEEIMKARMFPVEQVFSRFPRMVRDLAQKAGKEVNFVVEGRETELDRTVIEEIGDPLIHLLRNAIDHGIEPPEERERLGKPRRGTIELKAYHQENQIVITVSDDGRGMDAGAIRERAIGRGLVTAEQAARMSERDVLNLIFLPGFSTAETVTDVSGRGVGMDIVRNHLERINGTIDISTRPGRGTTFTIKLPLTLAINRSLLVRVEGLVLAFPLANVVEILEVSGSEVQYVHRQPVVVVRGEVLPLFSLGEVLGVKNGAEMERQQMAVVVAAISEKRLGFVVDELIGEQEIVIKPLGGYVGSIPGLAGATIMGDGSVALILDVRGLLAQTGGRLGPVAA